jgi:hypothetical protein
MTRRGATGIALVDFSDRVVQVAREINVEAGRQVAIAYRGDTTNTAFRQEVYLFHSVSSPAKSTRPTQKHIAKLANVLQAANAGSAGAARAQPSRPWERWNAGGWH